MPKSGETRTRPTSADAFIQAYDAFLAHLEDKITKAMKEQGFTATLKSLKHVRLPASEMGDVYEGAYERLPSGLYDAALHTDKGPLLLRNAQGPNRESTDPQLIGLSQFHDASTSMGELTPDQLLRLLTDAGVNPPFSLLCVVELARFDSSQHQVLLPLLWRYILGHRDSNDRDELVAVGAAIRKYIAIIPMDRMGELAVLLESGQKSPLPIELEIEVAKMIYRNFEVHPPVSEDSQPELAQRLWEIVQAYTNPRILLREKHSAAASLAIEAIVSMRSQLAEQAWQSAVACPYRWFAELVSDNLEKLHERWSNTSPDAAAWLRELRNKVVAYV